MYCRSISKVRHAPCLHAAQFRLQLRLFSDSSDSPPALNGFVDKAKQLLVSFSPQGPVAKCGLMNLSSNSLRAHTVVQIRHTHGSLLAPASIAMLHTALQQAKARRGCMEALERASSRLVLVADGPRFAVGTGVETPAFTTAIADAMEIIMDDIETMLRFPVDDPTVAVVRGSAIGVGAEIALACRELLLGDDAVLQLHEHAAGGRRIPSSVLGSYVWLRKAGGGLPQSALLTRKFTAAELERCGRAAAVFRFGPAFSELDAVDAAVAEQEAFDAAYASLEAASRKRRGEPPSEADVEKAFAPVQKLLLANPHRLPPSSNSSGSDVAAGSEGGEDEEEWDSPAAALAQYSAASKHLGGDDADAGDSGSEGAEAAHGAVGDAGALGSPASQPAAAGRGRSRRSAASRTGSSVSPAASAAASSAPLAADAKAAHAHGTPQASVPGRNGAAATASKKAGAGAAVQKKKAHRPEDDDSLLTV